MFHFKTLKPLTIFSVLALFSGCSSAQQATVTRAPSEGREHIFVYESDGNNFNTKTVFYDNGAEVVAFDAQFTVQAAQAAIDFLKSKTDHPIRYLVITHPNPDKFNGLTVFQANGAKVIASKATVGAIPGVDKYKRHVFVDEMKMFNDKNPYPTLGKVDKTFATTLDLPLSNGSSVHLIELNRPGVSSNQTIAYIPNLNALIVGDLIHFKAHAWLEGGIVKGRAVPTLSDWISDLNSIADRYAKENPTVYGGRGEAGPLSEVVPAQINYLKQADQITSQFIANLGDKKDDLLGSKASEAEKSQQYEAVQSEFKNAFPEYKLDYMIQYGIYGLLNSKL